MGMYIGGGIGPIGWSMPLTPRRRRGPSLTGQAVTGVAAIMYYTVKWSTLALWWMLYGLFLFYKYLAIACWWLGRKGWEWWQIRQGNRAAVDAANAEYHRQLAARADAENSAWLAGTTDAEYGQYPPHQPPVP